MSSGKYPAQAVRPRSGSGATCSDQCFVVFVIAIAVIIVLALSGRVVFLP